jgi:hypothetical protein
MIRESIAMAAIAYLLVGCGKSETKDVAVQQGAHQLSAAELKSAIEGNTLSGVLDMGMVNVKFNSFYAPDGRSSGVATTAMGDDRDKGKWHIDSEGKLCVQWGKWQDAKERCSTYFKQGDQYKVFSPEGKLVVTATILPGNTKNLPLDPG